MNREGKVSRARCFLLTPLPAVIVAFVCSLFSLPAFATHLPPDLSSLLAARFPGCRIRLDGAVETGQNELFLPLSPAEAAAKKASVRLVASYPNVEHPAVLIYSNGWCFLRLLKKGTAATVVLPAELPGKLRKQLTVCRFPTDLIVPDKFLLPQSLKQIIGETAVQTVSDVTAGSPEFGHVAAAAAKVPGSYFVTSLNSGSITLLNGKTFNKEADFPTEGTPCSMTWAEGNLYITDQARNRILILDAQHRRFSGQIDLLPGSAPRGIASLPNGRLIYVAESGANDIAVIETASKKVLLRTHVAPGPGRLAITPNGNFVLVLNVPSGQLTVLSTLNQTVSGTVKIGDVPTSLEISKDSRLAYISNRGSNTISVVDIGARQQTAKITTGTGPTGLKLNADGSKLYVANAKENTISVFNTKTLGKEAEVKLPVEVDFPYAIDLSPDGKRLLVSSESTQTVAALDISSMVFDRQASIGHTSHDIIWVPVQ